MRTSPALLAAALLAGAGGCGGARTAVAPKPAPSAGYVYGDGDHDEDESPASTAPNDDTSLYGAYGNSASAADTRAIATLARRYLAATASGDSANACRLLAPTLVRQLEQIHAADCPRALSAELAQQPRPFTPEDIATMELVYVHAKGDLGLAALRFHSVPEQLLVFEREGGAWKVDATSSSDMA